MGNEVIAVIIAINNNHMIYGAASRFRVVPPITINDGPIKFQLSNNIYILKIRTNPKEKSRYLETKGPIS